MKRIALIIGILTILLLNTQSVKGWGNKGHCIIAYTAEQHLTKKTKKEIKRALNGRSLVYYASWMDDLRNDKNPEYGQTLTWHYANVDEGETYESMKKNQDGDIVTALDMILSAMQDYKSLGDSVETDYIKYIIHLMGDMHCPMHAGRLSDRGGNNVQIRWFNKGTNLHRVWDSDFIESTRQWSYSEWQKNIDYLDKSERKAIIQGNHHDWFNETVSIAKYLYENITVGENYSYQYMYDNFHILETQLRNAGYRLAAVLNSIYD